MDNVYPRERDVFQYAEVGIFANDVVGIGDDGTVYEFVVIGVLFNESEAIMWIQLASVRAADYGIYDIMCYGGIGYSL